MKTKLTNQKGFTIIEVLIVLAIAGLIMLIVFLAVPALQRNSRNTQRRNEVSRYLGAVNEFINNNNGNIPSTDAHVVTVNGLANMKFLTPAIAYAGGIQNSAVTIETLQYVGTAKCDTGTIGNTVVGANRQFAVRFSVEDSAGNAVPQCQDS